MQHTQILTGHTSRETAYEVKDYPYGFRLRTSIFYWIESKEGKGDRLCTYTINPKNGRPNAVKCSTYATFMYLFLDENGHVKHAAIDAHEKELFESKIYFILEKIGILNVSTVQENNLRVNYYQHVKYSTPYEIVKYSPEKQEEYKNYIAGKLKHIRTCKFEDLVYYQAPPIEDNPSGEVKLTVTQYQTV